MSAEAMNVETVKAMVKKLWEGEVPLAQMFWKFYFVAVLVLGVLGKAVGLFGFLAVLWAGFMVMPVWRSAGKYKGKPLNALLAKIAAVLIGLSVLGSLLG